MASKNLQGPYEPYLNSRGDDLRDFGKSIERRHPMTWGGARPSFFEVDGHWWVLFHGILKRDSSQKDEGQRDVFLAPVRITEQDDAPPIVEILLNESQSENQNGN